jgi:two-component system sensor histidine kinase AgrC
VEQVHDMNKLFEAGFSTKGEGRGIGLHTVRKYADSISNLYLETAWSGDYFIQTLTIENGDKR